MCCLEPRGDDTEVWGLQSAVWVDDYVTISELLRNNYVHVIVFVVSMRNARTKASVFGNRDASASGPHTAIAMFHVMVW